MSDERGTQPGGSPVEETEATPTEVQAAVSRAADPAAPVLVAPPTVRDDSAPQPDLAPAGASAEPDDTAAAAPAPASATSSLDEAAAAEDAATVPGAAPTVSTAPTVSRIAQPTDTPSATETETASQIFAAAAASSAARAAAQQNSVLATDGATPAGTPDAAAGHASLAERLEADAAQQQPAPVGAEAPTAAGLPPVRDGEIRISADHPMATLYMQTPMPPDPRGNRGAGVLISLLSTLTFALLLAGGVALLLAPVYPPSTFLSEGLVPELLSVSYLAPVVMFCVSSILVVLLVGRSGWWAHIIGSVVVGVLTGVTGGVAGVFDNTGSLRETFTQVSSFELGATVIVTAFVVGIVAREVSMWFGAWIGARGRKVTRSNAEAMAEYEVALADVQATHAAAPLA